MTQFIYIYFKQLRAFHKRFVEINFPSLCHTICIYVIRKLTSCGKGPLTVFSEVKWCLFLFELQNNCNSFI